MDAGGNVTPVFICNWKCISVPDFSHLECRIKALWVREYLLPNTIIIYVFPGSLYSKLVLKAKGSSLGDSGCC